MKEENIQEAYKLSERKHTLRRCVDMVNNAKNIDDLQRAQQRAELDIEFPSLDIFKQELINAVNEEIDFITGKINAL